MGSRKQLLHHSKQGEYAERNAIWPLAYSTIKSLLPRRILRLVCVWRSLADLMAPLLFSFAVGLLWGSRCFSSEPSRLSFILCEFKRRNLAVSTLIGHILFNEYLNLKGFLGILLVSIGILLCQAGST
ncbi:hypothetical protein TcWFU_007530 [Taenia crassiceps]|uniref:EamA domain-containing protein n=1 Tax=Taenia crassiceps TaxID=6207 RepID=A0ABR4Q9W2_9CEST